MRVFLALALGLLLLRRADANSSGMTGSGCSIALKEGSVIMDSNAISSSSYSVVVKKGSATITSGSTVVNDGSTYTASFSAGGAETAMDVSGATFSGGSCSNTRVTSSSGSQATLDLSQSTSTVTVWGGWAASKSTVRISPVFTFTVTQNPTAAPTPKPVGPSASPTPSPTNPTALPTKAPTRAPTSTANSPSYSISLTFSVQGTTVSAVQGAQAAIISSIANALGKQSSSIVILSVGTSAASAAASRTLFSSLSVFVARLLSPGDVAISAQVLGYTSQSTASAASANLQTYLQTPGFAAQLPISLTVVSATCSVQTVAPKGFARSCALNPTLTLLWSPDAGAKTYTAMLKTNKPDVWLSGGIASSATTTSMVGNKVFVYAPAPNNMVGFYLMASKDAAGFQADSSASVLAVQSLSTGASMQFTVAPGGDASSNFIWSHGGTWPQIHDKSACGFTFVYWQDGQCVAVSSSVKEVSPGWVFLLLFLACVGNSFVKGSSSFKALGAKRPALPFGLLADYSWAGVLFIAVFWALIALVLVVDSTSITGRVTATTLPVRSGKVAVMLMWVVIIPTSKTSITNWLFGVPPERAVKYHRHAVFAGVAFALLHLLANLFVNAPVFFSPSAYGSSSVRPLFGLVAFLLMSLLVLTSTFPVRALLSHEVFKAIHMLYLGVIALTIVHLSGGLLGLGFLPGLLLHAVARLSRLKAWATRRELVGAVCLGGSGSGSGSGEAGAGTGAGTGAGAGAGAVTCLTVSAPAAYKPGHYYFLHLPGLTATPEWHPVSVSGTASTGRSDLVTFHVKSHGPGTWSGRLAAMAASEERPSALRGISLDGPFGSLPLDTADYSDFVFVCGGIGITALLPIVEALATRQPAPRSLRLVWALREPALLDVFRQRLQALAGLVASSGPGPESGPWNGGGGGGGGGEKDEETGSPYVTGRRKSPRGSARSLFSVTVHQTGARAGAVELLPVPVPVPMPSSMSLSLSLSQSKASYAPVRSAPDASASSRSGSSSSSSGSPGFAFVPSRPDLALLIRATAEAHDRAKGSGSSIGDKTSAVGVDGGSDYASASVGSGSGSGFGSGSGACVMVCGPPAMSAAVVRECARWGLACHSEAFSL